MHEEQGHFVALCDVYCEVPWISLCHSIGQVWKPSYITNENHIVKQAVLPVADLECLSYVKEVVHRIDS